MDGPHKSVLNHNHILQGRTKKYSMVCLIILDYYIIIINGRVLVEFVGNFQGTIFLDAADACSKLQLDVQKCL